MLTPEQAHEQLRRFRVEGGAERAAQALLQLPRALASAGLAFLGRDAAGQALANDPETRQRALRLAARALESRSAAERLRVFAALFPGLARAMEGAWRLFLRAPYHSGTHGGFRDPNN